MAVVNCVEGETEKDKEDIMHKKCRMFVHICARAHIDRNWQQHPSYFQQENI
jgi:dTDP-D-glucose 4,6-dehydratase